jgi:hypothetical protein
MYKQLVSDAMVSSALHTLRVRTIREGRPGLEHVEALMALRGHNLAPVLPARTILFRKGELSRMIRQALREGPLELRVIAQHAYASKPTIDGKAARNRVANALTRLKREGVVAHKERLWRLAY